MSKIWQLKDLRAFWVAPIKLILWDDLFLTIRIICNSVTVSCWKSIWISWVIIMHSHRSYNNFWFLHQAFRYRANAMTVASWMPWFMWTDSPKRLALGWITRMHSVWLQRHFWSQSEIAESIGFLIKCMGISPEFHCLYWIPWRIIY